MDLLISVTDTAGRLTGTARRLGADTTVAFSGALELLACIERLSCDQRGPQPQPSPTASTHREN
jgi:hypothetical protein